MPSPVALMLALLAGIAAIAYVFRGSLFPRHPKSSPNRAGGEDDETGDPLENRPILMTVGIVASVIVGGIMVLAGVSMMLESGNVDHWLPITGNELVRLLKDVVPGTISVVLGVILLEATNRRLNGRGFRLR